MKIFTNSRGLTLIELCTTLAIISIMAFSAISFTPLIVQSKRADSAITDVFRLFKLARTEAITSGSIVTICPLDKSGKCVNTWNQPISVFIDTDDSRSLNQDETLIKQIAPPPAGRFVVAPINRRYFQFDPLGGAKGTLGNITYCSENVSSVQNTRRLIISFSGRIRLARDQNGAGSVENAKGAPITCS